MYIAFEGLFSDNLFLQRMNNFDFMIEYLFHQLSFGHRLLGEKVIEVNFLFLLRNGQAHEN